MISIGTKSTGRRVFTYHRHRDDRVSENPPEAPGPEVISLEPSTVVDLVENNEATFGNEFLCLGFEFLHRFRLSGHVDHCAERQSTHVRAKCGHGRIHILGYFSNDAHSRECSIFPPRRQVIVGSGFRERLCHIVGSCAYCSLCLACMLIRPVHVYALLVGSVNWRRFAQCLHEFSDVMGPERRMRHGPVAIRMQCPRLNDVAAMGHARHQTLQDL